MHFMQSLGGADCHYTTRSAGRQMPEVVRMNTSFGDRSFAAAAPRVWNSLPDAALTVLCLRTLLRNC